MSPALDYLNKAAAITFDVTNNTSQSTAAVLMSRNGLVMKLKATAIIEEASTANYSTRTLKARIEYTVNNSTWRSAGEVDMKIGTAGAGGIPLQMVDIPVGLLDIVPEQFTTGNIYWRGTALLSSTLSTTDTFNISFYMAEGTGLSAVVP